MKHLKEFGSLNEEDILAQEDSKVYAKEWHTSQDDRADFDVMFTTKEGEDVQASFRDESRELQEEGDTAYSVMETIKGSSSNGKEYIAKAVYRKISTEGESGYELEKMSIEEKSF